MTGTTPTVPGLILPMRALLAGARRSLPQLIELIETLVRAESPSDHKPTDDASIALAAEDASLDVTRDDGHRGKAEDDKERLKVVVQKLNDDYGIAFDDADRVITALKDVLEKDDDLKAAMRSNSIEDLKKRKLKDTIQGALMNNADDNLTFLSKIETDPGFGKFFFSEMFKWYSASVSKPK